MELESTSSINRLSCLNSHLLQRLPKNGSWIPPKALGHSGDTNIATLYRFTLQKRRFNQNSVRSHQQLSILRPKQAHAPCSPPSGPSCKIFFKQTVSKRDARPASTSRLLPIQSASQLAQSARYCQSQLSSSTTDFQLQLKRWRFRRSSLTQVSTCLQPRGPKIATLGSNPSSKPCYGRLQQLASLLFALKSPSRQRHTTGRSSPQKEWISAKYCTLTNTCQRVLGPTFAHWTCSSQYLRATQTGIASLACCQSEQIFRSGSSRKPHASRSSRRCWNTEITSQRPKHERKSYRLYQQKQQRLGTYHCQWKHFPASQTFQWHLSALSLSSSYKQMALAAKKVASLTIKRSVSTTTHQSTIEYSLELSIQSSTGRLCLEYCTD
jgi:hypothetical protein